MHAVRMLLLGFGLSTALVAPAAADGPGPGDEASAQRSGSASEAAPDFFFSPPRGWLAVRGGLAVPRAGGDLFSFVSDQLTVAPSDFRSGTFNLEVGVLLSPTLAIEGGFDINRSRVGSTYRRFVTASRAEIAQTTRFNQTGVTLDLRYTPTGHGQRISRFAFIPRKLTPYVGAGLQMTYFAFRQSGDFVDFADRSIFQDVFQSDGWAFGPFARGGVDLQVWRRLYVNGDVRYTWMRADLGPDFSGFDGIDLAGVRGVTGVSVKF